MKSVRVLTSEEKEALIRRVDAGEAILSVAKAAGVLRKSLYEWRAAYQLEGIAGLNRKRGPKVGKRISTAAPSGPEADLARAQTRIQDLSDLQKGIHERCKMKTDQRPESQKDLAQLMYELELLLAPRRKRAAIFFKYAPLYMRL